MGAKTAETGAGMDAATTAATGAAGATTAGRGAAAAGTVTTATGATTGATTAGRGAAGTVTGAATGIVPVTGLATGNVDMNGAATDGSVSTTTAARAANGNGRSRDGAVTGAVADDGATIGVAGGAGLRAGISMVLSRPASAYIDTFGIGGTLAVEAGGVVDGAGNIDADSGGADIIVDGALAASVVGTGCDAPGRGSASIGGGTRGPGRRRMVGGWDGAGMAAAAVSGRAHSRQAAAVAGFLAPQVGQNIVGEVVRCATALKSAFHHHHRQRRAHPAETRAAGPHRSRHRRRLAPDPPSARAWCPRWWSDVRDCMYRQRRRGRPTD